MTKTTDGAEVDLAEYAAALKKELDTWFELLARQLVEWIKLQHPELAASAGSKPGESAQ